MTAAAADELTLFNTADGRAADQTTLMAPFLTALQTAQTNYNTQNDAATAATSSINALTDPIAEALAAKTQAQGFVDDQ